MFFNCDNNMTAENVGLADFVYRGALVVEKSCQNFNLLDLFLYSYFACRYGQKIPKFAWKLDWSPVANMGCLRRLQMIFADDFFEIAFSVFLEMSSFCKVGSKAMTEQTRRRACSWLAFLWLLLF